MLISNTCKRYFTHICFAVTIMDIIIWLKIFTTFVVFHKVKMKRLVANTTCLELARPSNQQFRLTCSNPNDYHCLLDDTFTKEFEVCREWKWIPRGKGRKLVLFKLWEHKSFAWMTSQSVSFINSITNCNPILLPGSYFDIKVHCAMFG